MELMKLLPVNNTIIYLIKPVLITDNDLMTEKEIEKTL